MNRKLAFAIALIITTVTMSGKISAQVYNTGLADKTIVKIGNEIILLSDLEREILFTFNHITNDKAKRCEVLENMLESKLLLAQARLDSLSPNMEAVDQQVNMRAAEFVKKAGTEKKVEESFKLPMYKIKQQLKDVFTEQSLMQSMAQKVSRSAPELTPEEVREFYKTVDKDSLPMVPIQYRLRQIVIYPDKESAAIEAKKRLLEFRDRITKGDKFSTIATLYSDDKATAINGGELGMAPKDLYVAAFADAAMALKPGQISQIVETPYGFHIIQMINRQGNSFNARHILIRPIYTEKDRKNAFSELDSIKNLVVKDSLTFEKAARKFSYDPKTAPSGGQMVEPNSLSPFFYKDMLEPIDYNAIKNLKEGEISDPFESKQSDEEGAGTIYKIIRIEKIIPAHKADIDQDFSIISNIAKNKEVQKTLDTFLNTKIEQTYIRIDPEFQQCKFRRKGWIKE